MSYKRDIEERKSIQEDKDIGKSVPNSNPETSENVDVAPVEREREKDNRAEAFRAMKKLGRSRKR